MNPKYEAVIGLEVHAQLLTDTKIFCGCSTKFGSLPNSNVCPVCLGHPGVLPVLNKKVVEYTVLMGLATDCRINEKSVFARKNYFYPDLPKGYQISQYEEPICEFGKVTIEFKDGSKKDIGVTRIHMEEDAGKSIHDLGDDTMIDLNRTGTPLMEIVSEPDMRSAEEAVLYLNKLKQVLLYLGICDGNMEEGSLRCDANISIRLKGETKLGTKAEVKNMNSFRNVEKAIEYEIERQIDIIEDGGKIIQQTLLWNAELNQIFPMRTKEEAHDYRYFPDPDLMPVIVDEKWRNEILSSLPELPDARRERFVSQYKLPVYDAQILTSSRELADYYEQVLTETDDYKTASNWVMTDVLKTVNEQKISVKDFSVTPQNLGKLVSLISKNTISGKIAKEVFPEMILSEKDPEVIVKEKNLVQISDTSELESAITKILDANPKDVQDYLGGKEKAIGFFVGQIMRETKGKANPQIVNELLKKKLEERR
ncbi:MAG: aspartyl/glutamyl-tRNA amidotransferase subunit B [Stygiobacter sp. RIFOXYA12_FULL_38_9]|nr:MAG: aspartyl/glutamyl-tRNA amidotransferase subunit B [Stygiobacter sp. RIFOXYA12_FULL_38_9]OGV08741.1 MAG: aspartyl/glutamyl-tRNA amidotransferase subunit B [Stygiobacter sp. RIFOXYB2_FULL_37_11]OGV10172.1 MAG: aspartyl/glutamyl-tRNA amidotransferase subunit B [Stygiobacter sp. RIFOXYA2_FULL_38_8]OGV13881.1 MAG: aspartyl/glutamyl-tRNA amidotransferase subunit B [Stygiobacter sp. RIFOXYC2_FULL_38_25]OGV80265.1 MAG: aspartyl/glutamyl-tRNA amidotransferase subunit B [Stygiobacter sp. GWF2_38_